MPINEEDSTLEEQTVEPPLKIEDADSACDDTLLNGAGADLEGQCLDFLAQPTLVGLHRIRRLIKELTPELTLKKIRLVLHAALERSKHIKKPEETLWASSLIVHLQSVEGEYWDEAVSENIMCAFNQLPEELNLSTLSATLHLLGCLAELLETAKVSEFTQINLSFCIQKFVTRLKGHITDELLRRAAYTLSVLFTKNKNQSSRLVFSGWSRDNASSALAAYYMLHIVSLAGLLAESGEYASPAIVISKNLCRQFIYANWNRSFYELDGFFCALQRALVLPDFPFAGLFISEFIRAILEVSWEIQTVEYSSFTFRALRALYGPIANFCNIETTESESVKVEEGLTPTHGDDQGCFQAGFVSLTPEQFAQANGTLNSFEHTSCLELDKITKTVLSRCLMHIRELCDQLACDACLLEHYQEDLFGLILEIVARDASYVNRRWFDRAQAATLPVLEILLSISWIDYQATADAGPLEKTSRRIMLDQGGAMYKRRVLNMMCDRVLPAMEEFGWTCLLLGMADVNPSIAALALSVSCAALKSKSNARALGCIISRKSAANDFEATSIGNGYRKLVKSLAHMKLDESQIVSLRSLVSMLLEVDDLSKAATLLRHLGAKYFPCNWLARCTEMVVKSNNAWSVQSKWVEILEIGAYYPAINSSAHTENFKVAQTLFRSLKSCRIEAIDSISRILIGLSQQSICCSEANVVRKAMKRLVKQAARELEMSERPSKREMVRLVAICGVTSLLEVSSKMLLRVLRVLHNTAKRLAQPVLSAFVLGKVLRICCAHRRAVLSETIEIFLDLESSLEPSSRSRATYTLASCLESRNLSNLHLARNATCRPSVSLLSTSSSTISVEERSAEAKFTEYVQHQLVIAKQIACMREDAHALRLVAQSLQLRIVIPSDYIPLMLKMCFSKKLPTAQLALRTTKALIEEHPDEFLLMFPKAIAALNSPATANHELIETVWLWLNSQGKTQLIGRLARLLVMANTDAVRFLIKGIARTNIGPRNARLLASEIRETVGAATGKHLRLLLFSQWLTQQYKVFTANILNGKELTLQEVLR